jgi:AraC family transcriptional regulator
MVEEEIAERGDLIDPMEDDRHTTLYIKNMVCPRCIKVVSQELTGLGLDLRSVVLGEVMVSGQSKDLPFREIKKVLEDNGFELIEDQKVRLIEKIKHAVLKLVQNDHEKYPISIKDSEFIAREVGAEYHSLSSLFSSVEGITIEHFSILQRIERAKEFLRYGELTLSEIAYRLGYKSVQHLSGQFKNVTGMTPSQFKNMSENTRRPIDHVI